MTGGASPPPTGRCPTRPRTSDLSPQIGPQLDGIGIRGLDRLLEDTLDPNRNVDQAFRATTLVLKNGQILSGLVLREEGAIVVGKVHHLTGHHPYPLQRRQARLLDSRLVRRDRRPRRPRQHPQLTLTQPTLPPDTPH